MYQILLTVFAFILTILFLVTIHEYGHYAVARFFGVKIEKFSVGFGKPIFKWYNRAGVEFSISWIPLGGYVKMYGETLNDKKQADKQETSTAANTDISDFTKPEPTGKAFSDLPPLQRLLIAFAGPAVNLLFTVFVFWGMFVIGKEAATPTIGVIQTSSPLIKSGLRKGDTLLKVNGQNVLSDMQATLALVDAIGEKKVPVTFAREGVKNNSLLDLSQLPVGSEVGITSALGFEWAVSSEIKALYPATISEVIDASPAMKAGLRPNDQVRAVNGERVTTWQDFTTWIREHPNQPLRLEILRDKTPLTLTLTPKSHDKNANMGIAGIVASKDIDIRKKSAVIDKYLTVERYNVLTALPKAIAETYHQAYFLLKSLGKIIIGQFSVKNLGGPISIADYSGKSFQAGWKVYFDYLAMISLTLAVMNLLPIPVLDGGHIVLCVIELFRGKPLPEKAVDIAMRIGLSILLSFMAMVIFLDLGKYLG